MELIEAKNKEHSILKYRFGDGEIRVIKIDNEPWFVGKDVAETLGYTNPQKAIRDHIDEEDRKGERIDTPLGGVQEMKIINESGLYSLILGSKLPTAKKFKHWVTSEVLPDLRKGKFTTVDSMKNMLSDPEFIHAALVALEEANNKNQMLSLEIVEKNSIIEGQKDDVLFSKAVQGSSILISVGEMAEILHQRGVVIGRNTMCEILRDKGFLIKRNSRGYNLPTHTSIDAGLMEIVETCHEYEKKDGAIQRVTTLSSGITPKGQKYFVKMFLKMDQFKIVPLNMHHMEIEDYVNSKGCPEKLYLFKKYLTDKGFLNKRLKHGFQEPSFRSKKSGFMTHARDCENMELEEDAAGLRAVISPKGQEYFEKILEQIA